MEESRPRAAASGGSICEARGGGGLRAGARRWFGIDGFGAGGRRSICDGTGEPPLETSHATDVAPPATRIGHVHLKVADLYRAIAFYVGVLGFSVMQQYGAQAAFLSAGGYHHHIGLNTWESRGRHAAAAGPHRAVSHRLPLSRPRRAGRRPAAGAGGGHPPRRCGGSRRVVGDLPARPGRERGGTLCRPARRPSGPARRTASWR